MLYHALAVDYDGTLATNGVVDDATVDALVRLRQSGRRVVLVTGRLLEPLLAAFPQVGLCDLVVAENGKPIIARLTRCIDGKQGAQLLTQQEQVRTRLSAARRVVATPEARTTAALAEAQRRGLADHQGKQ